MKCTFNNILPEEGEAVKHQGLDCNLFENAASWGLLWKRI